MELLRCSSWLNMVMCKPTEEYTRRTVVGTSAVAASGWFRLIVGGYGLTLANLDAAFKAGPNSSARNFGEVALGSSLIGKLNSVSLILSMISRAELQFSKLVEIGCGTGDALFSYIEHDVADTIVACEPQKEAFQAFSKILSARNLGHTNSHGDV